MTKIYQILDWDDHYENAKSKTIKQKSWASLPNKQDGLGYLNLVSRENGAALYGAFVAVILRASRQAIPRQGYLTDNGRIEGIPWTDTDLSRMTGIDATIIANMLEACCDKSIGWIGVIDAGIPQGYQVSSSRIPSIRDNLPKKEGKEGKGREETGEGISVSSDLEAFAFSFFGSAPLRNLLEWRQGHSEEWIKKAMLAAEAKGVKTVAYVNGILQRWVNEGYPKPPEKKAKPWIKPATPERTFYGRCPVCGFICSEVVRGKAMEQESISKECSQCWVKNQVVTEVVLKPENKDV